MTNRAKNIRELTSDQFKKTMSGKMVNITDSAIPKLDIWPYVELLVGRELVSDYAFQNNLVESVYRNQAETFDHILLPTPDSDSFVVIVVDLFQDEIEGHYCLNLKREYGISNT